MQPCQLKDNIDVLNNHIENIKNVQLLCHLKGLTSVLMMLMAQVPVEKGKEIAQSFLTFDEAFSLFLAFSPSKSHLALQQKHERKHSKEFICHPRYGLCVYVVEELFVV